MDVLEMAIWARGSQDLTGLVHHSDRRCSTCRFVIRSASPMKAPSDRSDLAAILMTALAESVNGLYKTEVIRKQGPWRSFEQLELATAKWVE